MLNIIKSFKYKHTNFKAGGLIPSRQVQSSSNTHSRDKKFIAPRKLDFRDMCLSTDNQNDSPHCAGYATAGMIEMDNWKN
jgi:hypothetical protein